MSRIFAPIALARLITAAVIAQIDRLPDSIAEARYSGAQRALIGSLYFKYVDPIYPRAAAEYQLKAEPYLSNNRQPTSYEAMHTLLVWAAQFAEKGEMSLDVAARFFLSQLDAMPVRRQFVAAFWQEVEVAPAAEPGTAFGLRDLWFDAGMVPTKWDTLEVHPCRTHAATEQQATYTEQCERETAQFWTVYLHDVDGGTAAVADVATEQQAEGLAALIETAIANKA